MPGYGYEVDCRVKSGLNARGQVSPTVRGLLVLLSFRACAGLMWAVLGGETESEYSMIMMLTPLCREGLRG